MIIRGFWDKKPGRFSEKAQLIFPPRGGATHGMELGTQRLPQASGCQGDITDSKSPENMAVIALKTPRRCLQKFYSYCTMNSSEGQKNPFFPRFGCVMPCQTGAGKDYCGCSARPKQGTVDHSNVVCCLWNLHRYCRSFLSAVDHSSFLFIDMLDFTPPME